MVEDAFGFACGKLLEGEADGEPVDDAFDCIFEGGQFTNPLDDILFFGEVAVVLLGLLFILLRLVTRLCMVDLG